MKTIGVLTGGGDCPGLNPAIKAVTRKGHAVGLKVMGIREGWKGLVSEDPALVYELTEESVRTIDRNGGTILGTSRTNPFKSEEGGEKVLNKIQRFGIEALIAIGGEDTLGVAAKLHKKFNFPVVGIPKTIDRDLSGTEYSLGFESSVQIICEAIDNLRTTAGSHSRIFVVETMGRHTGHLALKGGLAGGANVILIPEYPFDVNEVCEILLARRLEGHRYGIVVVSEGAKERNGGEILKDQTLDEFGHVKLGGIGHYLAEKIEKITKLETRYVILSHLQRGGPPVAYDRRMGYYFGTAAVEAILAQKFGMLTALVSGRVNLIPLEEAISKLRYVDVEKDYDTEKYNYKQQILY